MTAPRRPLRLAAFGTSVMAHGTWLTRLQLSLQVAWPSLDVGLEVRAAGGATSDDVVGFVRNAPACDVALVGVGINDVWRRHQDREGESVPVERYAANLREIFADLKVTARKTVLVTETPFGWDPEGDVIDVGLVNEDLAHYGSVARGIARDEGALVVDVRPRFLEVARQLTGGLSPGPSEPALWSDGVHLNALGDTLLARLVEDHLHRSDLLTSLYA